MIDPRGDEARLDPNNNPGLIAHAGTTPLADTKKVVASNGELWTSLGHEATLIDESASGTTYVGKAAPGSSGTAAAWYIKKIIETGGTYTQILFADGDTEYDNIWDNRGTLSYS